MTLYEAILARHSVRAYKNIPLSDDHLAALERLILTYNSLSGLHIQLVANEPKAFSGRLARYGKFKNVNNYIVMIGRKGKDLDELVGYWGEKLVIEAQTLGLNTCWVGLTYKKIRRAYKLDKHETVVAVIAIGYGETEGTPHKSREFNEVSGTIGAMPDWYAKGVEAALLAPTAVNQQKFCFELRPNDRVRATAKKSPYSKVDLGIAKYHFEVGSHKDETIWIEE